MCKIMSVLNVVINLLPPSFSATTISRELLQILAIWQHLGQLLAIFTAHVQKWLFMNCRLKFWHHHSISWPDFLTGHDISAIWGRFLLIFALDKLNVCHISTSGVVDLLTYKVCHVMRTSQWKFPPSFEVDMTTHCLVIALLLLIGYVTLWCWGLTFWPWSVVIHGGSRGQPSTKFEDPTAIHSRVILTSPIWYHWQCVCSHRACAVSRDLCIGSKFFPHIWNPWPRFAGSLNNFYGTAMTFKGRLLLAPLMLKLFFGWKFLSTVKIGPQNGGFWGKRECRC